MLTEGPDTGITGVNAGSSLPVRTQEETQQHTAERPGTCPKMEDPLRHLLRELLVAEDRPEGVNIFSVLEAQLTSENT